MKNINKKEVDENNYLLSMMFDKLNTETPKGKYDKYNQTWDHRNWIQFSPVKHNQEA